jgi:hypothetical protein
MGSPLQTVHIRRSSSPREAAAVIVVDGRAGVDLARVGLALGLDPASVRLNGYFLSRGPGHVSSSVTWCTLLAFFAARRLPTGADAAAPIAVDGKPATARTPPTGPLRPSFLREPCILRLTQLDMYSPGLMLGPYVIIVSISMTNNSQ